MIIDASLIKRLNRLFSGPLASRRGPHTQKLKKRFVNKFRFQQTSWNSSFDKYQKNEYKLFSFLNIESLSDRNRRSRYREFEMMEFMPELSSALDIYADEMTSFTTLNPILKIDSSDPNIKQILNTLFYDVLDIQNNLWGWTRNTIKYGDFFLYLHLDPDLGVKFSVGLPQDEIMRIEGLDPSNPNYVKYRWETEGHEFENFQIVHFRISSNERNAPYGVSVLENARRIFRQLTLMEDTIISYRVVRAPERRVFYIDVQGINPKDQEVYFEEIKNKLKRNQIVDPDSGDITSRYNPMPVHFMTPIPLLDGRTITIKQLSEEFEQGKQNYVYSVQDDTHSIVPGMVKWCGKNYTAEKIALVTLDNGGVVKTAPEHPFVMRDGSSKRADELVPGDSLMPLYTHISTSEDPKHRAGYRMVYDPGDETNKYVHRIVADNWLYNEKAFVGGALDEQDNFMVVHHQNFEKLDNSPSNLLWMGNVAHSSMHGKWGRESLIRYNKSEKHRTETIERNKRLGLAKKMGDAYNGSELHKEHNAIRKEAQLKSWAENKEQRSKQMELVIPDECIELGKELYRNDPTLSREGFVEAFRSSENIFSLLKSANSKNNRNLSKVSSFAIGRKLRELGYSGFGDYKASALDGEKVGYKNHKVASVQIIDEVADVYCMTVVGPNGENDRHNFGVSDYNTSCTGIDKNCNTLVFVNNSIEEDYYIPTRGPQSGTKIDTLSGGEYNGGVDDVKYLRNKLFTAIKIPSSYLEDNENANGQEALTQKDVRFARTICRLQSFIVAELEKIAQIHLAVLGLPGDKLINFKLSLNNPSMIWDLQEMEFWGKKLELAASAESILDLNFVYKKFFNFSNEEIHNIILGRQTDAKNFAKIEKIKAAAEGGGDLGGLGGDLGGLDMGAGGELGLEELGAESEAGEDAGALLSAPGKRLEGRERKRLDGKGTYRRVINPGNEGDGDLGLGAGPLDRALKTTLPRTVSRGEERVLSGAAGLTSNLKEQIKKLSADAESLISEYREKRGKF